MAGRPTIYSEALTDALCERLAQGESLNSICKDEKMPAMTTVFRWLGDGEHDAFRDKYAKAREAQADVMVDEILSIADDAQNDWMEKNAPDDVGFKLNGEHVSRSKLRVDARKWVAAKLRPKKYGDRTLIGGDGDEPIRVEEILSKKELARRLAFVLRAGVEDE